GLFANPPRWPAARLKLSPHFLAAAWNLGSLWKPPGPPPFPPPPNTKPHPPPPPPPPGPREPVGPLAPRGRLGKFTPCLRMHSAIWSRLFAAAVVLAPLDPPDDELPQPTTATNRTRSGAMRLISRLLLRRADS